MKNGTQAMHKKGLSAGRRLLVVTSTFPRWQGDREPPFVYELSLRLAAHFSVCVLAPHCPGAQRAETMDNIEVRRFRYFFEPLERLAYAGGIMNNLKKKPLLVLLVPFFLLAQVFAIFKRIRKDRVHAIHAHWLFPQGFSSLVAIACAGIFPGAKPGSRPRLVCTSHGGDLYGLKGGIFKWIKRAVIAGADAVTVVSRSMKEEIERLGPAAAALHVMPMGVDLKHRFVPPAERPRHPRLLFVGRLVEQKGLRYLLEAMPHVQARHPHVTLWVAGSGPQRRQLAAKAIELGLEKAVRFLGAVDHDDLPRLYQGAHIVVFPSVVREGFGLVLVEALGCGCAVIATDLPAVRELIVNGRNGVVIPTRDSGSLASAIIELLNDPKKMEAMGKYGRRFVADRFDWEPNSKAYRGLIDGTGVDN